MNTQERKATSFINISKKKIYLQLLLTPLWFKLRHVAREVGK